MHVYCAGPLYGSGRPSENIRRMMEIGDSVMFIGHVPFVPHLFHFWDLVRPHDSRHWLDLDLAWLERCDVMLRISGASPGADEEEDFAVAHSIPVGTMNYERAMKPTLLQDMLETLSKTKR